jgi:membrane-bound ClpP family serine protease
VAKKRETLEERLATLTAEDAYELMGAVFMAKIDWDERTEKLQSMLTRLHELNPTAAETVIFCWDQDAKAKLGYGVFADRGTRETTV